MTTTTVVRQDEARIRALLDEQVAAMCAKDADRLVGRYAPGAVTCGLAPPLRLSGSAVLDPGGVRAWFDTFDGPVELTITELALTVGEDVAFCHSLNRLSAIPAGASEGFAMWVRATVGFRKVEGRWWVTHEHTSTPFYMDGSFRAAVDLTP